VNSPDPKKDKEERTYRELGRFVMAFARVVDALESSIAFLCGWRNMGQFINVISGMPVQALIDAYVRVYKQRYKLPPDDMEMLKRIRKDLQKLTKERDWLMHAVWGLEQPAADQSKEAAEHAFTTWKRKEHLPSKDISPAALSELCDDAERLRVVVNSAAFSVRNDVPQLAIRYVVDEKGHVSVAPGY
jgi:hypothetical protein